MVGQTSTDELAKILNEKFTNIFRHGYVTVKGVTMPKRFEEMQQEIENWSVSEQDVWICSFPKTGTTWLQEMVWMIVNNLDFDAGQENLGHRSPFLEVTSLFDYRQFMQNNRDFHPPPFIQDSLAYIKSKNGPLCIKTHLPWTLLPREIQTATKKPKIIYIARNPKDTCVSYYHHAKIMEGYRGSFEEFYRLFLAGKLCFAPYWQHVLGYWNRRSEPNILFLQYEDLKKDLPKEIRKVANFLNKPLSDEQVELLNQHLSFESMRNNKSVNYEMIQELNKKYNLTQGEGIFMRSGRVGDYKAHMTDEMIQQFDEWTKKNTEGTGLNY